MNAVFCSELFVKSCYLLGRKRIEIGCGARPGLESNLVPLEYANSVCNVIIFKDFIFCNFRKMELGLTFHAA